LTIRGHEFHYSELGQGAQDVENAYHISDRLGLDKPPDGYMVNRTLGSYNHLHFGSQPEAAKHFVENCMVYQHQKENQV
jgi:cobyrinic acid a,c-diamide synthase